MRIRHVALATCLISTAACSRSPDATPAPSVGTAAPAVAAPHYGEVMAEIGRRFELAGRAAKANRLALANFELGEMEEAIDDDLPRAAPPRAGDPQKLAALLGELRHTQLPAMQSAAEKSDDVAFAAAFAGSSKTCNACHEATEHAFIEISSEPGKSVPLLDLVALPSASASAAPGTGAAPAAPSASAPPPAATSSARRVPTGAPVFHPPPHPPPIPKPTPNAR